MAGGFHNINDAFSSYFPSDQQKLLFLPFSTAGLSAIPKNWKDLLNLLEFIYTVGAGTYTAAIERAIGLAITPIQAKDASNYGSLSRPSKLKILDDLYFILKDRQQLVRAATDILIYGNSFVSICPSFTRSLVCPKCKKSNSLKYMLLPENKKIFNSHFKLSSLILGADDSAPLMGDFRCPACGHEGKFFVVDQTFNNRNKIYLRFWRPQDILIESGSFNGEDNIYHLMLSGQDRRAIESGSSLALSTWPLELINCAKPNSRTFRFNDGVICHLKEVVPSGVQTYGWGIPRALRHFQMLWQLCTLHKINEAIASEYSIPKRVITPAPVKGGSVLSDPNGNTDMGRLLSRVQKMFATNELGAVECLPVPIQYQLLGGEAKQLVPDTLLQQAEERLLNAIHVPVELYRMTLTAQATKLSLKIIETAWSSLRWELNSLLRWIRDSLSQTYNWPPVTLSLSEIQFQCEPSESMILHQLAAQGDVSKTAALAPLGLDFIDEQTTIYDEQKQVQENQMKLEDYMSVMQNAKSLVISQNPQTTGQPPQGDPNAPMGAAPPAAAGAPPAGGGAGPAQMPVSGSQQLDQMAQQALQGTINNLDYTKMAPNEQMQFAQQIAQQVSLMQPSSPERRQLLAQLRSTLPQSLYDVIYRQIEKTDRSVNMQGGQLQRQQGQQP
jgi:hypothetical protein